MPAPIGPFDRRTDAHGADGVDDHGSRATSAEGRHRVITARHKGALEASRNVARRLYAIRAAQPAALSPPGAPCGILGRRQFDHSPGGPFVQIQTGPGRQRIYGAYACPPSIGSLNLTAVAVVVATERRVTAWQQPRTNVANWALSDRFADTAVMNSKTYTLAVTPN